MGRRRGSSARRSRRAEARSRSRPHSVLSEPGCWPESGWRGIPRELVGAEWLGLPWLIDAAALRPSLAAAAWAARIDDALFDALPRGATAAGRIMSRALRLADDRGIDGVNRAGSRASYGAVALVVRLTEAAARGASHIGEATSDLIPEGTGRLIGMAGTDLRRLQSGQSPHYYVILLAGFALGAAVLILGG